MPLSNNGSSVAIVDNLHLAIALATFGYPFRLEKLRDEATGQMICQHHWHFDPWPTLYVPAREGEPMPNVSVATLIRSIKDGTLQRNPVHPVCDVLDALHIYECLRHFMERGRRFRIAVVPRGEGRCSLIEGEDPMSIDPAVPRVALRQLDAAVALVRLGVPVLGCDGEKPHRRLIMAAQGYQIGETPPLDVKAFVARLDDGSLQKEQPDHFVFWTLAALENRREMKRAIDRQATPLLVRDPKSSAWARRHRSGIVANPDVVKGSDIDFVRKTIRR